MRESGARSALPSRLARETREMSTNLTVTILVHASMVALYMTSGSPALGGSISITTELTITPRSGVLAVSLKVRNSGDEAAQTVVAGARFGGHEVRAPAHPKLSPGETSKVALDIPWTPATPGQWPLTTTVDYTDLNGSTFQAVQLALVSTDAASPALLAVLKVDADRVARHGRVNVRFKSLSELARHVHIQFIVPRGLEVDPSVRLVEIGPWADAEARATVFNRAALPGSRYPVFVTLEYDDDSGHHAALGNGLVEIVSAPETSVSYAWSATGVLLIAWVAVLAYRRHGRARLSGATSSGRP